MSKMFGRIINLKENSIDIENDFNVPTFNSSAFEQ